MDPATATVIVAGIGGFVTVAGYVAKGGLRRTEERKKSAEAANTAKRDTETEWRAELRADEQRCKERLDECLEDLEERNGRIYGLEQEVVVMKGKATVAHLREQIAVLAYAKQVQKTRDECEQELFHGIGKD